ncbi:MAG: hypothetical protein AAF623_10045, partial [Planctomycetota bacterium]
MKRKAAILGPTPQFVRWTLVKSCEYRDLDSHNLPYAAFRQLRSLRELSIAKSAGREIDGICIHSDSSLDQFETAMGFFAEEIFEIYGDENEIERHCFDCKANTDLADKIWAGCFGWVSASPFGFYNKLLNKAETDDPGLPDLVKLAADYPFPLKDRDPTYEVWYWLWKDLQPRPEKTGFIRSVLSWLIEKLSQVQSDYGDWMLELNRLESAARISEECKIPLQLELIPPGYS